MSGGLSYVVTTGGMRKQTAREDDIGGTNNRTSKGVSGKESKKIRKEIEKSEQDQKVDKERSQAHLHSSSSSDYHSRKRRQHLRDDDQDEAGSHSNLNPAQRRALTSPKKRPDLILQSKMYQLETKRLQSAMDGKDANSY